MRHLYRLNRLGKPLLPMVFYKTDEEDDEPDASRRGGDAATIALKYQNDANRMALHIQELESDNYKLRDKNRAIKSELDELKKKQIPDGGLALSPENTALWEKYTKLGKPEDLQRALETAATATQELATTKRGLTLRDVAADCKFDVQVLTDLDSRVPDLSYEQKEVSDEAGEKQMRWFVKYKEGDTAKEAEAEEFYNTKFPKYMPALRQDSGNGQTEVGPGTPYPTQVSKGAPKADPSLVKDTLARRYLDEPANKGR